MSFAILGLGTAVPATRVDQEEAVAAARVICRPDEEQAKLLPFFYRLTGIETRHMVVAPDVLGDVLGGTRRTGSVFLPGAAEGGPPTRQRLEHYAQHAGPLALAASRRALEQSALAPDQITHLITVSCTGFVAPGVDRVLITGLGLLGTVERTQVGFMGCHG